MHTIELKTAWPPVYQFWFKTLEMEYLCIQRIY